MARGRARLAALVCAVSLAAAACSSSSGTGEELILCGNAAVDVTAASDSERSDAEIAVDPPNFVAVGDALYTSHDAVCWARQSIEPSNESANAYGDGRFMLVGPAGELVVSDDGQQWNIVENENLVGIGVFAYGNNRYVGVGTVYDYGGLIELPVSAVSQDGLNWTHHVADLTDVPGLNSGFDSVTFGRDSFVAVGAGLIASSDDGINWTQPPFYELRKLFDVAYGNGRFVAVGNRGAIYSSHDTLTWSESDSGLSGVFFLRSVIYGNGLFVAVGDEYVVRGEWVSGEGYGAERPMTRSAIITSEDGVVWSIQHTGPSQSLTDVTYGNDRFVAVGSNRGPTDEWGNATSFNAVVLTSPNGTDWTATELGGRSVRQEEGYYVDSSDDPSIDLISVTSWPTSSES